MKLATSDKLARKARDGGYAVPALNTNGGTYDITRAIVEVAAEMNSPLIIQSYEPNLAYRGYQNFVDLVYQFGKDTDIPISIHLDHGKSEHSILCAMQAGFTSVMIDYAHLPFAENVKNTQKVIELAANLNVTVEAEIGHILIGADGRDVHTTSVDAETAISFAEQASPALLAVALGTTHGIFAYQDTIDFTVAEQVAAKTDIPLVLHGTCGIPMELIAKCAKTGISKINFGEGIRMAYTNHLRDVINTFPHEYHPWKIMQESKNRLKEDLRILIEACGSAGKA